MPIALTTGIVSQVVFQPATADCDQFVKFHRFYFSRLKTPKLHRRTFAIKALAGEVEGEVEGENAINFVDKNDHRTIAGSNTCSINSFNRRTGGKCSRSRHQFLTFIFILKLFARVAVKPAYHWRGVISAVPIPVMSTSEQAVFSDCKRRAVCTRKLDFPICRPVST